MPSARDFAARWHRYAYPFLALFRREVKKRYATTWMGVFWTLLQPLLLVGIYVLVFGFFVRSVGSDAGTPGSIAYILSGLLPFLALADGLQQASRSMREDRALLEQAEFPAEVITASRVASSALLEVVGLAIVVVVALATGREASGWLVLLPALVLLRIAWTVGLAWVVGTLTLFVSDLAEVLGLALTAWLLLTPIFYSPSAVPAAWRWLLSVNPLHFTVAAYRSVILEGRAPGAGALLLLGFSLVAAAGGLWFFRATLDRARDLA